MKNKLKIVLKVVWYLIIAYATWECLLKVNKEAGYMTAMFTGVFVIYIYLNGYLMNKLSESLEASDELLITTAKSHYKLAKNINEAIERVKESK